MRRWVFQDWGLFSHSFIPSFVIVHRCPSASDPENPVVSAALEPKMAHSCETRTVLFLPFVYSALRSDCARIASSSSHRSYNSASRFFSAVNSDWISAVR